MAPPQQGQRPAAVLVPGQLRHSSEGGGGEEVVSHWASLKFAACDWVSSRQADGLRVPHKQVLALVRLQHELGDADACRRAAVEHYGGRRHLGPLAAAGGVRRHHHLQGRS